MNVESSTLKDENYKDSDEIMGKCTTKNSIIPKGSLFYYDLLIECPKENND